MKVFVICLSMALLVTLVHSSSIPPAKKCWTETKKCRYVAVAAGYECKDNYAEKYARCHQKMKYKKKCDKAVYFPSTRPKKPADYIVWDQTKSTLVSYDSNYGPHVAGYPRSKSSNYYYSKKLPSKPYGVTEDPVSAGKAPQSKPYYTVPKKTGTKKPVYTAAPSPRVSSSGPPTYSAPSYGSTPSRT